MRFQFQRDIYYPSLEDGEYYYIFDIPCFNYREGLIPPLVPEPTDDKPAVFQLQRGINSLPFLERLHKYTVSITERN